MTTRLNPYLQFRDGKARDAITFYASVFGGEPSIMAFRDMGGMGMPDDIQDWVMHSDLLVTPGLSLMCSDVPDQYADDMQPPGAISLSGDDDDILRGWFERLADGGEVHVPLEKAPWGDSFGQLKDKFGVTWLVDITGAG